MEEIIMNLIMHSGEARSYAMEAMELAKTGNIKEAKELIQIISSCTRSFNDNYDIKRCS